MDAERVDSEEFAEVMRGLADRYGDRVSDGERRFVASAAGAGEWIEALEQLAAGLARTSATITRAERGELAGLFSAADADISLLDDVPVGREY